MKKNPSALVTKALKAFLFGLALLFALPFVSESRGAERPNILFFITDDESWLERSAYGWSQLPTPAFDRVAKQGVLFTNGFTSAPSCAPSRATVLTGRNFWELKQGAFIQAWVPEAFPLVTHRLAEHGYHVGNTGKGWGPGVHIEGSHQEMLGKSFNEKKIANPPAGINAIDYAANFESFLSERKSGQPFFFWAGVEEPHAPHGPENHQRLLDEFGFSLEDVSMPPSMKDNLVSRAKRANFVYEICRADQQLGRMLDLLERMGEIDNTLVVVTSDNGSAVGPRCKASAYDNGVHVPLAISWPAGAPAGRTVTDFVNFRDLAPTFLDLAQIQGLPDVSGKSLLPILRSDKSGRIEADRDWMMTGLEWHGEFDPRSRSSRSIRNDRYAYIVKYRNVDEGGNSLSPQDWMEPVSREFYAVADDRWECENLIDDPELADEIKALADRMKSYQLQTKDPRATGDRELFRQTRDYVQKRKRLGYEKTLALPFE